MAERALRGTSIGSKSLETEDGVVFAERKEVTYSCPNRHSFSKVFAAEANPPAVWECKCGAEAELQSGQPAEDDEEKIFKPQRTHWDMLMERRSQEELEELLAEQLKVLREGRLSDGVHYH